MRAVAYIRVSTNKEEQELSLEHQRSFFSEYIERRGDTLVRIYSDKGKSATQMKNRKELNALLAAAKQKQFEKLYVKDISRLFRNMLDFITVSRQLQDLGIQLHLVNMGEGKDIDPFTLNLMAMISEQESQKMSERVKFGKRFGKEKGIVPNFVYGYDRIDKYTLVPNEVEMKWVKKIFDLYTEELWGQARISKYLYENRVVTKKKKDGQPNYNWSQVTVKKILTNKIYLGLIINGKQSKKNIYSNERIENPEEDWYVVERPELRIISDEQFEKAQKIMKENGQNFACNRGADHNGVRRSDKHLFSNLIKCGSCGFSYRRMHKSYSENTLPKNYWVCSKRSSYGSGRCESEYIRVEEKWLMDNLSALFSYLMADKQSFYSLIESKCNAIVNAYVEETAGLDIETLENSLSELNKQRENLKKLAVKGLISMEEVENDMIPINKEIERIKFALEKTDKTREITVKVKNSIKTFFSDFEKFSFTERITNSDLKKIIREIKVISKEEIYVIFNVEDDIEGIDFPVNLVGLIPEVDNPEDKKEGSVKEKQIEEKTDTNTNNSA